ncbi:Uncharacterized protein, PA2063/DUF2235 family [Variovorax sp. OK605]|uniref:phospholipase effector Tle1 domain-containing protein n=1 Tax=Variovorax sp. OK605 TaxID=1855317 RepID=UPI0008E30F3B|nr:DUF2235 domain-containing protein [Variovorax sp. OK605]SFQ73514.1 Uncharacterized protein, PA2063/DUF2235 family [Variovorax sp. OK605]
MNKVIVYCADGTWNGPGDSDAKEKDSSRNSNVYRLFDHLTGAAQAPDGAWGLKRLQKVATNADGTVRQVAMYTHGVGANRALPYMQMIGGGFGGGLTTRLRLGYVFISRNYTPGDQILITGFSRGAYTARALADMIGTIGLLKPELAEDHKTLSYSAAAWIEYRQSLADKYPMAPLPTASMRAHRLFVQASGKGLKSGDLVPAEVYAIGVWDTVGSMGIPQYERTTNEKMDGYAFASTALNPRIQHAFHAVSADERRRDFPSTLWDPDPRVRQEVFPGAHADIGGGYAERGLSDVALGWMIDRFAESSAVDFAPLMPPEFRPDPLGIAHQPWTHGVYTRLPTAVRSYRRTHVVLNGAVRARMDAPGVKPDPLLPPEKYLPANLENLL